MAKKIILIIAIIAVFITAGLYYVNKVLLPVQIKGMIIKSAEEQLGRKVTFDALSYNPIKGAVITNLSIYSKDKPDEIFIHVAEASAQVLIPPLLQKKIIIPAVHINSPSIKLIRFDENLWNWSDLVKPPASPTAGENKPAFEFLVSGLSITNGHVKVTDLKGLATGEEITEMFEPINIKASLSMLAGVTVSGEIGLPGTKGSLKVDNVHYSPKDGSLKGDIRIVNLRVSRYLRFAPALPLAVRELSIASADLTLSFVKDTLTLAGSAALPAVDLDLTTNSSLITDLTLDKVLATVTKTGGLSFQGGIVAKNTLAKLSADQIFEGTIKATVTKLSAGSDPLAFNGKIVAENVKFTLDPERSIQGTFRTNATTFSQNNGQITATTDLDAKGAVIQLGSGQSLKADIVLPVLTITPSDNSLALKTDIKLSGMTLTLGKDQTVSGDFSATQVNALIADKNISATMDLAVKGLAAALPDATVEADLNAPGTTLSLKNGVTALASQITLKKFKTTINKATVLTGQPTISFSLENDPKASQPLTYKGLLKIENGMISGIPSIDSASDIQGRISFSTDQAQITAASLTVLKTPLKVSGTITTFADPYLDLAVTATKADLGIIEKVLPQLVKDQGLKVAGSASISAHITSSLKKLSKDPLKANIKAEVRLKDVSLDSSKAKQSADKINGKITYETPTLSWKELNVTYQKKNYLLNGYLQDFQDPTVAGSLKTDDLQADFQVKKTGDDLRIDRLVGSYLDSTFDLTGLVKLPAGADPVLDMNGDLKVSLRDLLKVLPAPQAKQLDDLKLAGMVKVKANIKGKATDWMNWRSTFKLETPALYVMGYEVNDLAVEGAQKDGVLDPFTVDGSFYTGTAHIISKVKLKEKDFPFETSFKLDRTNLELFKKATPLKDKQLSGFLTVIGNLDGKIGDIRNVSGKSTVAITDGYLWSLDILSKVLSILSSSFQGGNIIITDADATLTFDGGRIITHDLALKGTTVTLLGDGWIDWDQNIEFNVTPRLEAQTGSNGTLSPLELINPTAGLVNIRISGTLKAPKIEHDLSAPTIIKKTLQNTVGGLLKIFE
jgi:hypothetical protein